MLTIDTIGTLSTEGLTNEELVARVLMEKMPHEGDIVFCTDDRLMYVFDGKSFVVVGDVN